jgi:hypothetical protein
MLWRQGDIFVEDIVRIPPEAVRLPGVVLAEGEITGHHHRIEDPRSAALYFHRGEMLLSIVTPRARLVHDEHGPIELDRGAYRVWRQREYEPIPNPGGELPAPRRSVDTQNRATTPWGKPRSRGLFGFRTVND